MSTKKKNILIGEDDPGIVEVITIVLKDYGYIPHTASSYKEITAILEKTPIDMIFLDVLLQGESGSDIAKSLKSNSATSAIPLVMLSANMKLQEIAKESGADGYLSKPFDLEDFISLIKKHT